MAGNSPCGSRTRCRRADLALFLRGAVANSTALIAMSHERIMVTTEPPTLRHPRPLPNAPTHRKLGVGNSFSTLAIPFCRSYSSRGLMSRL